jgi:membrane protein
LKEPTVPLKDRLRGLADRVPGLTTLGRAGLNYVMHQSANQAGSVAFSVLLAMFPLLLLLAATAGFVGRPGDAGALADRVLDYMPAAVRDALAPAVEQVLRQRNQALLAVGLVVTVWTASSGMQAVRTALNKAYGVERGLPFWQARIKVTVLTVIAGFAVVAAFGSVIVLPYAWRALQPPGGGQPPAWLWESFRYGLAYVVLSTLYVLLYASLPDIRQRWLTVLPGALLGAGLWVATAAALSLTLRSVGKLALVYGGFAGIVATLVFLYLSATTLIFGAEFNAVLRERRLERERSHAAPG